MRFLFLFVLIQQSLLFAQLHVDSIYDKKQKKYLTNGSILVPASTQKLTQITMDFAAYPKWILDNINGEHEKKSDFLTLFHSISIIDSKKESFALAKVLYDLNLIFPFGSKNNELYLELKDVHIKDNILKKFVITLKDSNLAIKKLDINVSLYAVDDNSSKISFHCSVFPSVLLNLFLNIKKYKKNIEWRIIRIIKNIKDEAQKRTSPHSFP